MAILCTCLAGALPYAHYVISSHAVLGGGHIGKMTLLLIAVAVRGSVGERFG